VRLLVLGGSVFVGRHIAEAALARGHEVSVLNRGRTSDPLPPEVERLRGDRDGDLGALRGRTWDVAVDTSGYLPAHVRGSSALLADAVDHLTFVSTISVYADLSRPGTTEDTPLARLDDTAAAGQVTGETYGPLKALCEQEAERAMPGRVLVVRPGIVCGPHDPTERFTHWVRRLARGGEVRAPGRPDRPVQLIDARDLAGWILGMAERRATGVFNAAGPPTPMEAMLNACGEAVAPRDWRLTWTPDDVLLAEGSEPPLWIPDSDPQAAGFFAVDSTRAVAAGLTFRPLADSARDALAAL
jgi:2'-hydroxyisoflavone reductase